MITTHHNKVHIFLGDIYINQIRMSSARTTEFRRQWKRIELLARDETHRLLMIDRLCADLMGDQLRDNKYLEKALS